VARSPAGTLTPRSYLDLAAPGDDVIREFLRLERERAGWRFWLLWVAATNLGFFPGLALGQRLAAGMGEPLASGIVGGSFATLVGTAQWGVLRRHLPHCGYWMPSTTAGFATGATITGLPRRRLRPRG
jgi:hypothetical protein